MPGTWTLPDTGGASPFLGAHYQNDEEKGENQSKLKSKKPKHTQNPSPLPLPAQPQLELKCCFILSPVWGVCHGENAQDVPSNGHMTCPAHCRDHSRLQLTTSSQKKPPVNPMKTFIESVPFPGNDLLNGKNNIPKKLECVPCSLLPNESPGKAKLLSGKPRNATNFYCLCA